MKRIINLNNHEFILNFKKGIAICSREYRYNFKPSGILLQKEQDKIKCIFDGKIKIGHVFGRIASDPGLIDFSTEDKIRFFYKESAHLRNTLNTYSNVKYDSVRYSKECLCAEDDEIKLISLLDVYIKYNNYACKIVREKLKGKNMKRVIFFKRDGYDANLYNLEEVYDYLKESYVINISSLLLLDRFKQAVKDKEIDGFNLVAADFDDTKILCSIY